MRVLTRGMLFAFSAVMLAGATCWSQIPQRPVRPVSKSIDLGMTFAVERSKPDPSICCFWFKGGGVDASMTLWRGFGVAAAINGDHASNYLPHTDENKISFLVGPRYTFMAWKAHGGSENQRRLQLFGQGLVGTAHGFNTRFSNGATSANEFAFQAGGGANLYFSRSFGVRPIDLEFVHTQIGATGFSNQNDFRVATGLIWHF